jgi:hypothetical protein
MFDPSFETVDLHNNIPESEWQKETGFAEKRLTSPPKTNPLVAAPEGASEGATVNDPSQGQAVTGSEADPPRRSTRTRVEPDRLNIDDHKTKTYQSTVIDGEIFAFTSQMYDPPPDLDGRPDVLLEGMAASADPDTMYYHEAMREPDKENFIKAMWKEFNDMLTRGVIEIVKKCKVPEGVKLFPAVWAMKRKRNIMTREVYKWKARLNFDGSKQVAGRDYEQTYAPVASWESIRLLLALVLKNNWYTRQLDYVLAFPQADVEWDCFMKIPRGIIIDEPGEYVLKVNKNIYGQKQAGRVWNKHLVSKLKSIGFKQSDYDECVFYKGNAIYLLYTDDSILAGPDNDELDEIIEEIKSTGLDITDEGDIEDFLGVNIERIDKDTYHLRQPHLIDQILKQLRLDKDSVNTKTTPALASKILSNHKDSDPFDESFHYRSVIGKLNYLEKCTRPDIAYAVHQCARFSIDPRKEHGEAVRRIGRYLKATRDKGIIIALQDEDFKVFADSDFSGNWNKKEAEFDPDTARSRTGYIIQYMGVPLVWKSQLQTEIALSSTEAEYICLSQALRVTIPLMNLIKEFRELGYPVGHTKPNVHCTLFEDNSGALTLAKAPAMRPRTKHINIKYHHFRQAVEDGSVDIVKIDTADQPADVLTKPLPEREFVGHRQTIQGW